MATMSRLDDAIRTADSRHRLVGASAAEAADAEVAATATATA